MKEPLRILLIDDNPDDRALALRALEREFPALRAEEISGQAELARALDAGPFDLVITDYQLRWGTGLDVLRTIRERFPECPVIMFTNSGSQEIAVEAMKSGLDDYVLKSAQHFVRLPVAVRTALERREAKRRAEALDRRLRALLNRVNVGIFRATPDGQLLESNPALTRLLDIREGEDVTELDLRALGLLQAAPTDGTPIEREVALRQADGQMIWVAVSVASGGTPGAPLLDGLVEDITARKRAEEAARFLAEASKVLAASLEEEQTLAQMMRLVVPRLADGCVVDLVGGETPRQLVFLAPRGEEIPEPVEITPTQRWAGVETALQAGHATRYETFTPADTRALRGLLTQAANGGAPSSSRPTRRGGSSGSLAPRAALVAPLAARGRVFGALTLVLAGAEHAADKSELSLVEEFAGRAALALENARLYRAAREAIEVRDRFLSLAAHELRTPLASMIPSIQLTEQRIERLRAHLAETAMRVAGGVAEGAGPGEQGAATQAASTESGTRRESNSLEQTQDALRRLRRQARRLSRLVDDLVDVTRIQRGLLELRRAPHDLREITREAAEERRLAEPGRQIALELPEEPLMAEMDGDRIGQVITNFLTNALKFSPPEKPVTVRLTREAEHARLAVHDAGPGMPKEELARIWDLFYRARGLEHQSGSGIGLGLGLYISQEIITRSGGEIGAESTLGQGSTFWFTLPLEA